MIYTDVTGFSACVRRFNATHQIGCSSDFHGNTGVIHYMASVSDVQWLLDVGPHKPYIALMEPQVFLLPTVNKLTKSGKVSGIMVININSSQVIDEDFYFSPDLKCPNDNFGFYSSDNISSEYAHCGSVEWNPAGNGMNFMDFDIPIISLYNETEVQYLIKCYKDHNEPVNNRAQSYPLCAAELHSFMFGAKDTPTCMRRTQQTTNLEVSVFCDPIGDFNVWMTLKPTNKDNPLQEQSLIVAAAQIDSFSLFYNVQPGRGAEHAASSYITLLAVAQALGALNTNIKQNMTDIMFAFFQGESYDYIGSSRMVYDMLNGSFPYIPDASKTQPAFVTLKDIRYFLELNQLALVKNGNVYAHIDPITYPQTKTQTDELLDNLQMATFGNITIKRPDILNQPVPPASFQQFLRSKVKVPGIVLTDHQTEYQNNYYNSRFDSPELINIEEDYTSQVSPLAVELSEIATTVARALYKLARPHATDEESIRANVSTIHEMLYCFLVKANCPLFRSVVSKTESERLSNVSYDAYVGVFGTDQGSLGNFVYRLLGYFTGNLTWTEHNDSDETKDQCKDSDSDQISHYFFMQGPNPEDGYGYCVKSNVNLAKAQSPAFIDGQEDWTSTQYSTWTESQWSSTAFSARVYLKPSPEQESVIFCLGMVVVLMSLLVSYFFNARANILFSSI
ncbi:nicastrin-like isoform X2 [Patiria miniata]|nr:nicastrin-like isoform X2 [Patiria miniata]